MRCQQIQGRAHPDPEGNCLILNQVHATSRPEHLQLSLQLREMQHGGNQCRTGPPTNPVSSRSVDAAFEQLHRRGHRCYQRRWPIGTTQHEVLNLHSRSPQSLQLCIRLPPCSQLHCKLSGGPRPDDRPIGPDRLVDQGASHRSSQQATQVMNADPPSSRIQRPAHPLPPC
jgi:hypothetical protein